MITDQTRRELAQRDQTEIEKARAKLQSAKALGIEFEEPIVHKRSRLEMRFGAHLDLLMQFPGQWARLKQYDNAQGGSNGALALRKAAIRPGRWEFRGVRTPPEGTPPEGSKLYARYLGPDSEGPKS